MASVQSRVANYSSSQQIVSIPGEVSEQRFHNCASRTIVAYDSEETRTLSQEFAQACKKS
jgi:hypothetical protein